MGRKGKKNKQPLQDQGGTPAPSLLPGEVPPVPQPSTSAVAATGEKKQEPTTGSDQRTSNEKWATVSKSHKDDRGYRNTPPTSAGDSRDQPSVQAREQTREQPYQSGRGWEKSGVQTQTKQETSDAGRYQQRWDQHRPSSGGSEQGQRRGPPPRQGGSQGQQWSNKGQQGHSGGSQPRQNKEQRSYQGSGQNWRNKGSEENIGSHQQGQRYGRDQPRRGWEQKQQISDKQQSRDDMPTERRYQQQGGDRKGFGGYAEQQKPGSDAESQENRRGIERTAWPKPQSPKVTEKPPEVSDSDKKWGPSSQGAHGAPDKVQIPYTSTIATLSSTQEISQLPRSEGPTKDFVAVYKEPGTLFRKKIKVQSNHFALDLGDAQVAYHYDVTITEFDKNKPKRSEESQDKKKQTESKNRRIKDKVQYKVVREFLKKHFPDRYPSFDGKKNLYAARPLTNNLNDVLIDTDIRVIDDFEKEKTFSIEIKDPKMISLVPQSQAESSRPPMLTQTAIQCLDIVLRNAPICFFNQIGSSFFSKPRDKIIELGGGMEMYYGFYQSVINGGRPYLNLHLVHKAFPKNMPVLDAFVEILTSKDRRTYQYQDLASLPQWQSKALNDYIKDLKVAYEVPKLSKVIYRVNKLVGSPREEIMIHNGTKKTILEYFRTEKSYDIKYPDLPLLWVGNPKGNIKILIPPELCTIEKDQSVKRKMEDFQTRSMIKEAATDTHQHRQNTMNRFYEARYNESPCVQEFKFSVSDKFEIMDARILPTPQLLYGQQMQAEVKKGTWSNKKFLEAKSIGKWAIVDISNDRYVNRSKLDDFVKELKNAARSCGVEITGQPDINEVRGRGRYSATKADVEAYFKGTKSKNYDIIFVIVPSSEQGNSIYSYVKRAAELIAGCLTQCVKAKTITGRFNMTTATNILLKVNGKLDGINHTFSKESKPEVLRDGTVMIMGADVTHPGPTAGNMPSVAAVIASHDPKAFQYNLCLRLQEPTMEYIVDLKEIVKEQLMFFLRKNDAKPSKIIYFRDGVSEGQFSMVLAIELTAIQNACKELQKEGYNPAITFLVVQKRHHTRLFPLNDKDSDDQNFKRSDKTIYGNYNVPAGTCVDTTIVTPTTNNFYLVSHASIKGVARPTKYSTLWDDLHLTSDEIQELSYYLCHMFARCNRSVSYPAPTYYAHLAALRGKAYIKPALDDESFDMANLQKEMAKIKIQFNILNDNPMFFI